jgi:hypothetical protein
MSDLRRPNAAFLAGASRASVRKPGLTPPCWKKKRAGGPALGHHIKHGFGFNLGMDSFELDENEIEFIEDDDWTADPDHLPEPGLFQEIAPSEGSNSLGHPFFGADDDDDDFSEWITPPEIRERIKGQIDGSNAVGGPENATTSVQKGRTGPVTDSAISRIGLSHSDKAGMENVDLNKANQIIYEMSKVRR